MALKRPNPLSGAFKSEKAEEPPKVEAEAKTAGPSSLGKLGEEKTPTELPKDKDPKTAAGGPTKPTEDKTAPTEPPKDSKDPKATADGPAKPTDGKGPAEPPKDGKDPKAAAADGPTKPTEGKATAEPPKDGKDPKATADGPTKLTDGKGPAEPPKDGKDPKATADGPTKPTDGKGPAEPPKDGKDPKATADGLAKPTDGKGPAEPPKDGKDLKAAADGPAKPTEGKATAEPPKDSKDPKATADGPAKSADDKATTEENRTEKGRFVKLADIKPLPGTYIKDTPRSDYSDMIASIKKNGLEHPVILRQGEKGDYQLVDGFHRCEALKKAGMLEVRADVYAMKLTEAMDYRQNRAKNPPIPGTLVLPTPPAPPEKASAEPPKEQEPELPKDLHIPLTPEGKPETVSIANISDLHTFEGHPFNVSDDKDMMDLVESIKQFGVLEPVTVIPREKGGYEMISGHRRRRACELAGVKTIPVIVRQLDRDEATIAMVDANLKRENISPMEKARAYKMKLDAMKRKAGRRSKAEILSGEKPARADEQLAQQTGESRATIQRLTRLTKLEPKLQEMVDKKELPVNTAADISYLKKEEQKALVDSIEKEGGTVPSGAKAAELKKESQAGTLTTEKIEQSVAPTKREVEPELKVTFTNDELRPYFPAKTTTVGEVKKGVFEALILRQKALERQKAQAAERAGKGSKDGKGGKKPSAPSR